MLTSVWERGKDAWLLGYHVACQENKRRLTVSDFNLLVSVLFRVSIFFFTQMQRKRFITQNAEVL